jgi:hypothetical protein
MHYPAAFRQPHPPIGTRIYSQLGPLTYLSCTELNLGSVIKIEHSIRHSKTKPSLISKMSNLTLIWITSGDRELQLRLKKHLRNVINHTSVLISR